MLRGGRRRTGRFGAGLFFCALFAGAFLAGGQVLRAADDEAPRIVTDAKANTVTIFVGGRPIVRIDGGGLHVDGDVAYAGVLKDAGSGRSASPGDAQ